MLLVPPFLRGVRGDLDFDTNKRDDRFELSCHQGVKPGNEDYRLPNFTLARNRSFQHKLPDRPIRPQSAINGYT